jgi:hypothetical protein
MQGTSFGTWNWVLGWRSTQAPTQLINLGRSALIRFNLGRIIADAMVDSSPHERVEKNTLVHKGGTEVHVLLFNQFVCFAA